MEIIYLLAGIIALIQVICFFYLCANVASIKKRLNQSDFKVVSRNYNKYRAFGDFDRAKESLMEMIWLDIISINEQYKSSRDARKNQYLYLKETKYKDHLENLNLDFPDEDIASER